MTSNTENDIKKRHHQTEVHRNRGDAKEIHPRSFTISEDKPPTIAPPKLPKLPREDSQKLIHQMSSPDLRALHNHPIPKKLPQPPEIRRSTNFEAEKIQHYVQGTSAFDLLNDFKEVRKEQLQIQRPTRLASLGIRRKSIDNTRDVKEIVQKLLSVDSNILEKDEFVEMQKLLELMVDMETPVTDRIGGALRMGNKHVETLSGDQYIETILLTHTRFMQSVDLLAFLFRRYTQVKVEESTNNIYEVDPQRSRIMKIVETWMISVPEDFQSISMATVLANWMGIISQSKTPAERTWSKYIKKLWDTPNSVSMHVPGNITPTLSRNVNPDREAKKSKKLKSSSEIIDKLSPIYIACQLTILDFELFCSLNLRDLLTNWESNPNSTLIPLRDNFTRIVQWMITEIVSQQTTKYRIVILQKMIRIGEALLKLNNMNGAYKVYKALSSPGVARLQKTWKGLPADEMAIWEQIEMIMNPESEYIIYNNLLRSVNGKSCFVPSIYILLEQIERIEVIRDTNEAGGINYRKLSSLARHLQILGSFKKVPYNIPRDSKLLKCFKDELRVETNTNISNLSRKCELTSDMPITPSKTIKRTIEAETWYYGNADRKEAENILTKCDYDAFLIRVSSTPGSYALSTFNRSTNTCFHSKITPKNGGYVMHGSNVAYEDVADVIPDLQGYQPAWNETAKEIKKKYHLPFPSESDEISEPFKNPFNKFNPVHGTTYRFFEDNKTSTPDRIAHLLLDKANDALNNGDFEKFLMFVKAGLPINSVFRNSQTLYHIAADSNQPGIVQFILECDDKPDINTYDSFGWTPLHSACKSGNIRLIDLLLRLGARVNPINKNGSLPLHYLVRVKVNEEKRSYVHILDKMLKKGASVNAKDVNLETPLHQACAAGNSIAVRVLLSNGADCSLKNGIGQTPLDITVNSLLAQESNQVLASKYREIKEMLQSSPDSPRISIAALPNEIYLIENAYQTLHQDKIKLQIGKEVYKEHFFMREHTTVFGRCNDHGPVLVSIPKEDPELKSEYPVLVRSKKEEYLTFLTQVSETSAFIESLRELTKVNYFANSMKEMANIMVNHEQNFISNELKIPLIYFKENQYTLTQALKNTDKEHSEMYEDFLKFLGTRTSGTLRRSRRKIEKEASIDYYIHSKFQEVDLYFASATVISESKRRNLQKRGILVVFLEASSFDPAIFEDSETNVIVVIQPETYMGSTIYNLAVCYRRGIPHFSPRVPYPPVFVKDDYFRQFLFTKLIHGDKAGITSSYQQKYEVDRERELNIVHSEMILLPDTPIQPRNGESALKMYKKGSEIGRGATGTAYIVKHKISRVEFCDKEINKTSLPEHVKKQVFKEIDILSKLHHDNIIKLIEHFDDNDSLHLILELCFGGSLGDDVVRNGVYSEPQAARVMFQLMDAVAYMHSRQISHRDIKPDNVLFSDKAKRKIKLIDFGFGKDAIQADTLGVTRAGTFAYIAPEMASGLKYNYYKVDCWSCGCVAYFLLFGRPPFGPEEKTFEGFIKAIRAGELSFDDENVKISQLAKSFMKSLLCVDPDRRVSAEEALHDPWFAEQRE